MRFTLDRFERDIWSYFEIHAGCVGLVDWIESFGLASALPRFIQVYH